MKIDEFITQNREPMDVQLPPEGHIERFAARLQAESQRRRKRKMAWQIGWTAAAAAVVLPLFLMLPTPAVQEIRQNEPISEVAGYYRQQLNDEIDRIEKILPKLDSNTRRELLNELKSTQENLQMLTNFPEGLSDEEKITIVAVNYDHTIQIIKDMGENLKVNQGVIKNK